MGAILGRLADYGIDDKFIKEVSKQITPGTSALFLYVAEADHRPRDRPAQPLPTHADPHVAQQGGRREAARGDGADRLNLWLEVR